ncbi:hypothetical protein BU26DRAFT_252439 [Trematosphaeria pertusa]|uniref:Putative gamma-glutamylcyclotransferase n=1 Tax=Trematosphaeria pertusa TaxID=390896 RepID=A0A6A6INS8_9PLEO|nr:uncharacterized protein BU26DRAFT_252439 [Trematosphaeria pertusa]KAF2252185.1 hypothetical protein BU26DRAFT_252439 [Trematosphaeria pertusa]
MTEDSKKRIDPEDLRLYGLALNNRWSTRQLYHHVAPEVPIFVYGSLMLPWVVAKVLGIVEGTKGVEETTKRMTRATLRCHFRVTIKLENTPTIVKTKKEAAVDGMLLGRLDPQMASKIEEYIGPGEHRKQLEEVEVETDSGETIIVCAYMYVWKGSTDALIPKSWTPMDYMRSRAGLPEEQAVETAALG